MSYNIIFWLFEGLSLSNITSLLFLFTSHIISSVYIKQVGNDVDEHRRTECVSHVPAIKTFFKVKKRKQKSSCHWLAVCVRVPEQSLFNHSTIISRLLYILHDYSDIFYRSNSLNLSDFNVFHNKSNFYSVLV